MLMIWLFSDELKHDVSMADIIALESGGQEMLGSLYPATRSWVWNGCLLRSFLLVRFIIVGQ